MYFTVQQTSSHSWLRLLLAVVMQSFCGVLLWAKNVPFNLEYCRSKSLLTSASVGDRQRKRAQKGVKEMGSSG